MIKLLLFLFITIPLLEIYLLITVGGLIGAIPTITLILFTAVVGVFLLRLQGLVTLAKIKVTLDQGELPAIALVEGLILLVSGALLLTPGFFTDTLGFLCLVPVLRKRLAIHLFKLLIIKHNSSNPDQKILIEGEFRRED